MMRLLGELQPPRFMAKFEKYSELGSLSSIGNNEIVSVKPLGDIEVMGLTTSTATYFSDGYASHNSADNNGLAAQYGMVRDGDPDIDLNRHYGTVDQFNTRFGTHILPLGEEPEPPTPITLILGSIYVTGENA